MRAVLVLAIRCRPPAPGAPVRRRGEGVRAGGCGPGGWPPVFACPARTCPGRAAVALAAATVAAVAEPARPAVALAPALLPWRPSGLTAWRGFAAARPGPPRRAPPPVDRPGQAPGGSAAAVRVGHKTRAGCRFHRLSPWPWSLPSCPACLGMARPHGLTRPSPCWPTWPPTNCQGRGLSITRSPFAPHLSPLSTHTTNDPGPGPARPPPTGPPDAVYMQQQ